MRRALGASIAFHALVLGLLFLYAPSPVPTLPPVEVVIVPAESLGYVPARGGGDGAPVPAATSTAPSRGGSTGRAISAEKKDATPDGEGGQKGGGGAVVFADPGGERKAVFDRAARGEDPLVPWTGAPGTPGGPEHPDEALDGNGRLGSGQPGDPRIPGFGGVDVGRLIARDSTVLQAKERAERGQIHPFLFEAKRRMESCWQPSHDDAIVLRDPKVVDDPVCAQGYHLRYRVAKVLVIYDAAGSRVSLRLIGAPNTRQLEERVQKAIDEAGLEVRPPPAELLDERGLLRLAWNVYVDDYTGCNLMGKGTSGRYKDGLEYVVGVIELEGVF